MAGKLKYALRILIVLLVVALAVVAARYLMRPDPVTVVLAAVGRGEVQATVSNTRAGTVKACRRARLAPATGGQVAKLSVREGDRVDSGQILMVIWNEDLEARVQLAASEELAASARVQEACLNAEVAKREAERQQRLGPPPKRRRARPHVRRRTRPERSPGPAPRRRAPISRAPFSLLLSTA